MSNAQLLAEGRGTLCYRLMIEGWPVEFVTDPHITAADNLDGRTVLPGLSVKGTSHDERLLPAEGKLQVRSNVFRIVPMSGNVYETSVVDPVTAALSVYPDPVSSLAIPQTSTSTVWGVTSVIANGVYHVGTEAVRCTGFSEGAIVTRQIWDTQAQAHNIGSGTDSARSVYIYDTPPTMEGRRAYLYRYVDAHMPGGDDPDGDGTPVWRGIVSRPPRTARDGASWEIEVLPITYVLEQQIAARGTISAKPVGILHHSTAAFAFVLGYGNQIAKRTLVGLHTESTLITAVNTLLASALTEVGLDTYYSSCVLQKRGAQFSVVAQRNATTGNEILAFAGGSFAIGFAGVKSSWTVSGFPEAQGPQTLPQGLMAMTEDHAYEMPLDWSNTPGSDYSYIPVVANPVGNAANMFPVNDPPLSPNSFKEFSSDYPAWRIFVDEDLSGADKLKIDNLYSTWEYAVAGTGVLAVAGFGAGGGVGNVNYVDLVPRVLAPSFVHPTWPFLSAQAGFYGVLTSEHVIEVIRGGISGSLVDLRDQLVAQSIYANDGDVPFITDADVATWVLGDSALSSDVRSRHWEFVRPRSIAEVLAQELMLAAHFIRLESDGTIGLVPMEFLTDAQPVADDHDLDKDSIFTPDGNSAGSDWPRAEPQRDGIITSFLIQQIYEPVEDKWLDVPLLLRDPQAIAIHKNRGKRELEIKPFSAPLDPRGDIATTAGAFLRFFSADYIVVTIKVSYARSSIRCGDRIRLTHRLIPNGDGTRGVVSRTALVVGKRFPFDPAESALGELVCWMQAGALFGYAQSAFVTGQVNDSGNTWTITCSTGAALNVGLSTDNDGLVLKHYAAGDFVQVAEYDSASPTIVIGTVVSVDAAAGTITVAFGGTWTPGASTWWLVGQPDPSGTASTDNQRRYAYAAGSDLQLPNSFARRTA